MVRYGVGTAPDNDEAADMAGISAYIFLLDASSRSSHDLLLPPFGLTDTLSTLLWFEGVKDVWRFSTLLLESLLTKFANFAAFLENQSTS